ncbi:MAG: hypothetical protein GDA67_01275 [Nitrospira sp. CR1.3]|nr:hypothetical protein [Nitrospira sp. CR1.3]
MTVAAIAERVRGVLEIKGADCPMDELVTLCPDLTWNQVFMAIDHLNRSGQIRLNLNRSRIYTVRVLQRSLPMNILG